MGISTRAAGWAAALTLAFTLTGCGPTGAEEPAELTDEQAYALAEETYRRYLDVFVSLTNDPNQPADLLSSVVGGEALSAEIEGYEQFQARGSRLVGAPDLLSVDAVGLTKVSKGVFDVELGICLDYANVDQIDASGTSRALRPDTPLASKSVTVRVRSGGGNVLTYTRNGGDFCAS